MFLKVEINNKKPFRRKIFRAKFLRNYSYVLESYNQQRNFLIENIQAKFPEIFVYVMKNSFEI